MEPSWHQNRTKNLCEHRNAILRKSCSHCSGGVNFLDSGFQVGSKSRSKIDQKRKSRWEGILASIFYRFLLSTSIPRSFKIIFVFLKKNHDFEGSGGRSWEQKSIKNLSKKEVNMRRHLGIDFSSIFVDFGSQVGAKLGGKMEPRSLKGIEKTMRKWKAPK